MNKGHTCDKTQEARGKTRDTKTKKRHRQATTKKITVNKKKFMFFRQVLIAL
jgi:hypothetical protein